MLTCFNFASFWSLTFRNTIAIKVAVMSTRGVIPIGNSGIEGEEAGDAVEVRFNVGVGGVGVGNGAVMFMWSTKG